MFLLFEIVTFVARSRSVVIERLGKIGGGGEKNFNGRVFQ